MMQGQQAFRPLAFNSIVGCALTMLALHYFKSSLASIWICYGVFNVIRLLGALRHHFITGPFGRRARKADEEAADGSEDPKHRGGFWQKLSLRRQRKEDLASDVSHADA